VRKTQASPPQKDADGFTIQTVKSRKRRQTPLERFPVKSYFTTKRHIRVMKEPTLKPAPRRRRGGPRDPNAVWTLNPGTDVQILGHNVTGFVGRIVWIKADVSYERKFQDQTGRRCSETKYLTVKGYMCLKDKEGWILH